MRTFVAALYAAVLASCFGASGASAEIVHYRLVDASSAIRGVTYGFTGTFDLSVGPGIHNDVPMNVSITLAGDGAFQGVYGFGNNGAFDNAIYMAGKAGSSMSFSIDFWGYFDGVDGVPVARDDLRDVLYFDPDLAGVDSTNVTGYAELYIPSAPGASSLPEPATSFAAFLSLACLARLSRMTRACR